MNAQTTAAQKARYGIENIQYRTIRPIGRAISSDTPEKLVKGGAGKMSLSSLNGHWFAAFSSSIETFFRGGSSLTRSVVVHCDPYTRFRCGLSSVSNRATENT
jgi:hypothetical protein